jgi:hypothetical protein
VVGGGEDENNKERKEILFFGVRKTRKANNLNKKQFLRQDLPPLPRRYFRLSSPYKISNKNVQLRKLLSFSSFDCDFRRHTGRRYK